MNKVLEAAKPSKQELMGAALVILFVLTLSGVLYVNGYIDQINSTGTNGTPDVPENVSDKNMSDVSENNPHYYDKACWHPEKTNLSNQTYYEENRSCHATTVVY